MCREKKRKHEKTNVHVFCIYLKKSVSFLVLHLNRSLRKTLTYVYTKYGIKKGLYRGLSLNYIRCVPSQAVAFTTYEFMKQFLHLN